jgi:hypothetical protein
VVGGKSLSLLAGGRCSLHFFARLKSFSFTNTALKKLKDETTMTLEKPMTKVLIYGGNTGWIGGLMHDMCKEKGR